MKFKFKNRPLVVVFLVVFLDLLGYSILIPVVPQLFANPESSYFLLPATFSIQTGYILLGLLLGIYPLMQFFATPILGQLSDRYGRKKILAISLVGTAISYVAFAIAIMTRNVPLLFISRGFDGITGGNIAVAQASIADISTPQNRAKNFGLIGAALGLGFIVGPYIGGTLSDPGIISWFSPATPFWFAAILSSINVISVLLFFPETLTKFTSKAMSWFQSLQNIAAAYTMKGVKTLFVGTFLFQAGLTFFITFFGVYLIRRFEYDQGATGEFFAFVGICMAFSQIVITRTVAKFAREWRVLSIALPAAAVCVLLYFLPTAPWQMYLITPFFAAFLGLIQSNLPALISRSVGPDIQGEVLGINSSVNALAQAIPPIISGYIAASLTPNAPIFISAVCLFTAGIILWKVYKPTRQMQRE